MKHDWFKGIEWDKVEALEIEVPIKMDIKDKMDTEHFDHDNKSKIKRTRA